VYAARIVFETQGGATEEAVEGIYGPFVPMGDETTAEKN
jgi:hypothetical protein